MPMLHTTAEHMQDQRALFHPPQPSLFLPMTIYITTHHLFSDSFLIFIILISCYVYLYVILPLHLPFPTSPFPRLQYYKFIYCQSPWFKSWWGDRGWVGTGSPDGSGYQAFPLFRKRCNHGTMWGDSQQTSSSAVKYVHRRKHQPVTESPTHHPVQENLLEIAKLFPFLMIHANTATGLRGESSRFESGGAGSHWAVSR